MIAEQEQTPVIQVTKEFFGVDEIWQARRI